MVVGESSESETICTRKHAELDWKIDLMGAAFFVLCYQFHAVHVPAITKSPNHSQNRAE